MRFLALVLAVAALLATPAPPSPAAPQPGAAPPQDAPAGLDGPALVARDARVSFGLATESRARADLERERLSVERRAVALVALGCAGAARERPRLVARLADPEPLLRAAAVLALGELGGAVADRIRGALTDPDPLVAECALLAMLRLDRAALRREVDAIAGDRAHPLSAAARELLVFDIDPASAPVPRAARLLFEWRWEAAKRYGLVDGRSWATLVVEELVRDERFLDEVVVRAAADLEMFGIRDHLAQWLLERPSDAVIRAAARGMPRELGLLVRHELWKPREAREWEWILDEIDEARLERSALDLLYPALRVPGLRLRAMELLARAGEVEAISGLAAEQKQLSVSERITAAGVWGALADPSALEPLSALGADPSPAVRRAVLLNRARLGDREAQEEVRRRLSDPSAPDWGALADLALRWARSDALAGPLAVALPRVEGVRRVAIAARLALRGNVAARPVLREALEEGVPEGPYGLLAVRALVRDAGVEDAELLSRLFPLEGRADVNAEVVVGLAREGSPTVLPVLRRALWRPPIERSMLAAALMIRIGGLRTLEQEIERAPSKAGTADLRRVGYALGWWGGVEELERLAGRWRRGSGDPVLQGAYLGALAARTQ